MNTEKIIGGILVGGRSRRMGRCKALLPVNGRTFVEQIVHAVQPVAAEVVLLGSLTEIPLTLRNMAMLPDPPGTAGPLSGLTSLLTRAGDRLALLVACDMPLITAELLGRLANSWDDSVDATVFRMHDAGRDYHPCCGIFHSRVLPDVERELSETRSFQKLLAKIRCRIIPLSDEEGRLLMNINSPVEYRQICKDGEQPF